MEVGVAHNPKAMIHHRMTSQFPLIILGFISFFNSIDARVIGAIAESIKRDMQLTDTQLGLVTGFAFSICYAVFSLPLAYVADRGNRARIIAMALAAWSFMTVICGLSSTYARLVFARMGVAIGESGFAPAAYSLIADYYDDRSRARAMATLSVASALGTLMAFVLGGMIAHAFGWRMIFLILGAPGLILSLVAWFRLPEPRLSGKDVPDCSAPVGGLASILRILAAPGYASMAAGGAALTFSMAALLAWSSSFFQRSYGWEVGKTGLILGLTFGCAGVVSPLLTTYIGDRLAVRRGSQPGAGARTAHLDVVIVLALLAIPSIIAGLLVPIALVSLAMIGLTYILIAGWAANIMATVRTQVAGSEMATAAAIMGLSFNLVGFGLGPLTVGVVSDMLHSRLGDNDIRYALLCSGLSLTVGFALLMLASRKLGPSPA